MSDDSKAVHTFHPGKVAYEAYRKFSDGKSLISGQTLPLWEEQSPQIQNAWKAAGLEVMKCIGEGLVKMSEVPLSAYPS